MIEYDPIAIYRRSCPAYKELSFEDQIGIAKQIANGDDGAWEFFVCNNLGLVLGIVPQLKGNGLSFLDLVAAGNIGLIRAVNTFKPERGAQISTHATRIIRQSIWEAIADQARTIRIPIDSSITIATIRESRERLTGQLGRVPSDSELATDTNLTEKSIGNFALIAKVSLSLDETLTDTGSSSYREVLKDPHAYSPSYFVEGRERKSQIMGILDNLDPREKEILIYRYGLDGKGERKLKEVSQMVGRTSERVRQIQKKALEKLRGPAKQLNI